MKKLSVVFVALAAAFCTVNASALEATVVSVKGKVEIQEAGLWVSLEEGDTVEKGTVISTGFNSEAVLSVKESNFTLGPLTRITVEDLTSAGTKDNTQLFIDSGSISVAVDSAEGRRTGFKVRSPVATASVRGTEFKISSSGRLSVSQGLVSFGPSESTKPEITPDVEEKEVAKTDKAKKNATESVDMESPEVAVEEEVLPVAELDAVDDKAAAKAEKDAAKAAAKAEKEAAKAEKAAAKKHDDAFASTEEVGGFTGVPVAAGQTSKTNVITGGQSSPRSELAAAATGAKASATVSETAKMAQSTASGSSSSAISENPVEPQKPVPVAPTTGTIKISVSFVD